MATLTPSLLVKVPAKKPMTAKVEYSAVFESSPAFVLRRPPPPRPFKALNIPPSGLAKAQSDHPKDDLPGHKKQTNATMVIWTSGLAYQAIFLPKIDLLLYIQPDGRMTLPFSPTECSGVSTVCVGADLSSLAIVAVACDVSDTQLKV